MSSWLQITQLLSQSDNYYRLQMEVTGAEGIDSSVFLYLQMPLRPEDAGTEFEGQFQGVCSPTDMVEVPIDEPYADAAPPWFRADRLDLLFRNLTEYETARAALVEQLEQLLYLRERLDIVTGSAVLEFGTAGSESASA